MKMECDFEVLPHTTSEGVVQLFEEGLGTAVEVKKP